VRSPISLGRSSISTLAVLAFVMTSCAPAPPSPAATSGPVIAAPTSPATPASAPTRAPQPTPTGARKLVIAYGAIPTTGDPAMDTNALAMDAYDAVFDKLVEFKDGQLVASVATSWQPLSATSWEFKLRNDVKFHNGEALDANAVKFSLDRMLDAANKIPWRSQLGAIDRVEAPDATTIRISTTESVATLPQNLLVAYLVPPKYLQEVGKDRFAQAPIGSGPFKFRNMDPLTHFTVVAAPESWRRDGKPPTLDEITWKKLPEDATRVAALQAGEVDVAEALPYEYADQLKGAGMTVISQPIAQTLTINLRSTIDGPLKDAAVRQALNYAIDKEAIIKSILQGNGSISQGQLIGKDGFGFHPGLKAYPYDPKKAKELLAAAGFPNGFEMTFHASQGRYPKDKDVAEVVSAQLAQVGVKAKIEYLENAVFSEMSQKGTIGPINIYGWQYMPAMDISQPIPFFMCSTPRKNFCDQTLDSSVEDMLRTVDQGERARRSEHLAEVLRETAPVIFLWQFHSLYGIQSHVKGYEPGPARKADLTKVSTERR
jgi:peptide/nickel transport system substrate-binding protein